MIILLTEALRNVSALRWHHTQPQCPLRPPLQLRPLRQHRVHFTAKMLHASLAPGECSDTAIVERPLTQNTEQKGVIVRIHRAKSGAKGRFEV